MARSRSERHGISRTISVMLVGMLLGAAMLTPAFAGGGVTKKFVKKTAKKIAASGDTAVKGELQAQIDALKTTTTAASGPVAFAYAANKGGADKPLGTFGPFTLTARCKDQGGNPQPVVEVTTSVDNANLNGANFESDFDINESPKAFAGFTSGQASSTSTQRTASVRTADATAGVVGSITAEAHSATGECSLSGVLFKV